MRILIAIGVPRQAEAGAAGVALSHARELGRLGHHVDCWFREDVMESPGRNPRFDGLRFAYGTARRILREREKYDVVNLHAPWGCVYGCWKKWRHPRNAPPYVLTMQGSEERYAQAMREEDRKGRAAHFGWKNRVWHRAYHQRMYDYAIRTADGGVVATREGVTHAELKYGLPFGRLEFVPNGVESSFFMERNYTDNGPLRLLYVGTWLDRKGIFYLVEAVTALFAKHKCLTLTIAGCLAGEEEVTRSFAPELRSRICVRPFVKREDMPALYAEHDIFAFPSLVEGMPLTLLEAMASGLPVLTTSSSGMADVVEDGFNGLLAPPANSEKFGEGLERLCAEVGLRAKLGQEAQKTMRRYTWEIVTRKLEHVLMEAASRNKPQTNAAQSERE